MQGLEKHGTKTYLLLLGAIKEPIFNLLFITEVWICQGRT